MCGKYTDLSDAYLSVIKALQHACMAAGMKLQLTWVEAQYLEPEAKEEEPEKYEESWKNVSGARRLIECCGTFWVSLLAGARCMLQFSCVQESCTRHKLCM